MSLTTKRGKRATCLWCGCQMERADAPFCSEWCRREQADFDREVAADADPFPDDERSE